MTTLGMTHHVEIAEVMSGIKLSEKFVESVEDLFTSIPVQMSFVVHEGCDAVMNPPEAAHPAEDAEIEFIEGYKDYAYDIMTQLVKALPVEILIMHGDELVCLKMGLEDYFEDFTENEGNERAYKIAEERAEADLCAEADHQRDKELDRKMEETWEE